jgi:two-component sensor histidine kinase
VHRRLYTSDDVRSVEIDDYLSALVQELDLSMKAAGHRSWARLFAEALPVPTDQAIAIGVIVTELVTNAFKYAYGDQQDGEVRVSFRLEGTDQANLTVEDDGIGWNGDGPAKGTGLGSRIVKAMADTLGATVQYGGGSQGMRISLQFPLRDEASRGRSI